MRKLLLLLVLAGVVWYVLSRRREPVERAVVGYDDGSSVTLEPGSPGLERLLAAARAAVGQ